MQFFLQTTSACQCRPSSYDVHAVLKWHWEIAARNMLSPPETCTNMRRFVVANHKRMAVTERLHFGTRIKVGYPQYVSQNGICNEVANM
jgi:hypothetical protein